MSINPINPMLGAFISFCKALPDNISAPDAAPGLSFVSSWIHQERPDLSTFSPKLQEQLFMPLLKYTHTVSKVVALKDHANECVAMLSKMMDLGVDPWKPRNGEVGGFIWAKKIFAYPVFTKYSVILNKVLSLPSRPSDWDSLTLPCDDDEHRPLLHAFTLGNERAKLEILLAAGARLSLRDASGYTPLAYASQEKTFSLLRSHGAQCHNSGWRRYQVGQKKSIQWPNLLQAYSEMLQKESPATAHQGWEGLIEKAVFSRYEGVGNRLWEAVDKVMTRFSLPRVWPTRGETWSNWPLDAAASRARLEKLVITSKNPYPCTSKWFSPEKAFGSMGSVLSGESDPGILDAVWVALDKWRSRDATLPDEVKQIMKEAPSRFWTGVLRVLDEWLPSSAHNDKAIAILGTLLFSSPKTLNGYPGDEIIARHHVWIDNLLKGQKNPDKKSPSNQFQSSLLNREGTRIRRIKKAGHPVSEEDVFRWLNILSNPMSSPETFISGLEYAHEKGVFWLPEDSALSTMRSTLFKRFSSGATHSRLTQWFLSNAIDNAPARNRLRL